MHVRDVAKCSSIKIKKEHIPSRNPVFGMRALISMTKRDPKVTKNAKYTQGAGDIGLKLLTT